MDKEILMSIQAWKSVYLYLIILSLLILYSGVLNAQGVDITAARWTFPNYAPSGFTYSDFLNTGNVPNFGRNDTMYLSTQSTFYSL
jgi:hypothetical protein